MAEDIAPPIKTMQLYSHMDRIWNELSAVGINKDSTEKIPVGILNRFDCLNYGGAAGAARSVPVLLSHSSSSVLDVGSGLGGPARCVSDACGARVTGIELQADLAELGNALSARCGLSDSVSIVCGSILDDAVAVGGDESFDAAMSWLVILHIPLAERGRLFARLHRLLRPGARVYIEDFYKRDGAEFSAAERELLSEEVYVPDSDLPTREQYVSTVSAAGFSVDFEDVSSEWVLFTVARRDSWQADKERHIRVHNEATWESLDRFYCAMASLFQGSNLGGVRMVLTKI